VTKPGDPQMYRVTMKAATGRMTFVDVKASTGDEAATLGLDEFPGGMVAHVEPVPQKPAKRRPVSDETMVEIDSLAPDAKVVA
jgi:hypothetical protein